MRAGHGLRPLRGSRRLGGSAGRYARWMLRADYFGHQPRIRASLRYSRLGENLAWHTGLETARAVHGRGLAELAPHRAQMLSRGFRWLGAGLARGRLDGRRHHLGAAFRPLAPRR